jgi:hypothetical protein
MCLQAIRCNIHEFCCNGLQGVTLSYMALHDHLVSVTAIFFAIMSKLPVNYIINIFEIPRNITISEIKTQRFIILIDGRVIASYSRGQIVLPKSNMLEETRRSRGVLSYLIKGELFGKDYRQQLPYHLIN